MTLFKASSPVPFKPGLMAKQGEFNYLAHSLFVTLPVLARLCLILTNLAQQPFKKPILGVPNNAHSLPPKL
jgi:hypothetical protein